ERRGGERARRPVRADPRDRVGPRLVERQLRDDRKAQQQPAPEPQRRERERREQREEERELRERIVDVQRVAGQRGTHVLQLLRRDERDAVHERERRQRESEPAIPPQRARETEPDEEERLILLQPQQQLRDDQRRGERSQPHRQRAERGE